MSSTKATAHRAGIVYFVFSIVAVIGEFMFPTFQVPGDAAATAHNIASAESAYRLSILTGFATHLFFIVLIVILYKLFKAVDQSLVMTPLYFGEVPMVFWLLIKGAKVPELPQPVAA